MTARPRVGVLHGGQSSEHDVSRASAANVMAAIDRERYEIVPLLIGRDGRWTLVVGDGSQAGPAVIPIPGGQGRMLVARSGGYDDLSVDVLFPVLHGPRGEDGAVQGLAETLGIAYVGCDVLSSAVAMDKDVAKRLLMQANLPVARCVTLRRGETDNPQITALGLPLFVKPACEGSSFGVSKVADAAGLAKAVTLAFKYGDKVLVEEFVAGREIECAVLERETGELFVSRPGEIVPSAAHGFYTHDAKYVDADGALVKVPADVSPEVSDAARAMAASAFRTLGCRGLARVDFFLRFDGSLAINEVNTMPGFTNISMFPKALAADGIGYGEVVDILIRGALQRRADRSES